MIVKIDNSEATHACSLIVKHVHFIKLLMSNCRYSREFENKVEKFFLAEAGEKKEVLLQFKIGEKRK